MLNSFLLKKSGATKKFYTFLSFVKDSSLLIRGGLISFGATFNANILVSIDCECHCVVISRFEYWARLISVVVKAAWFPVAPIMVIRRKFDLGYPPDPLVSPFRLGHDLKGEPPFWGEGQSIQLVCQQEFVCANILQRQWGGISIRGMKYNHYRIALNFRLLQQILK